MTTIFALLSQACGLSRREAADYLDVSTDTVRSWTDGRRAPRIHDIITKLAELADRIDTAADKSVLEIALAAKKHGPPGIEELGLATDDHEAQGLGWPCVGAHRAVIALTVARGMAEGYTFTMEKEKIKFKKG